MTIPINKSDFIWAGADKRLQETTQVINRVCEITDGPTQLFVWAALDEQFGPLREAFKTLRTYGEGFEKTGSGEGDESLKRLVAGACALDRSYQKLLKSVELVKSNLLQRADSICQSRYKQFGRVDWVYGVSGRQYYRVPDYLHSIDQIRETLYEAFVYPLREGQSKVIEIEKRDYLISRKGENRSVSLWKAENILGKGSWGEVSRVWSLTKSKWIARKTLYSYFTDQRTLLNEVRIVDHIHSKGPALGICRKIGLGVRETKDGKRYFTHSRMARRGNLLEAIRERRLNLLSPLAQFKFCERLLEGLVTLSNAKVHHNDLSCKNIFLDYTFGHPFIPVIGDFGSAWIDSTGAGKFHKDVKDMGYILGNLFMAHEDKPFLIDWTQWIKDGEIQWEYRFCGAYLAPEYPKAVYELIKDMILGLAAEEALTRYRNVLRDWEAELAQAKLRRSERIAGFAKELCFR